VSNAEKVARAAFPFVVMPPRGWTDGERQAYEDGGRWTEGQEAARKVRSTDLATAAIDALADVGGIGGVLLLHERIAYHSETNYEGQRVAWVSCGCGWVGEPRIADNIPLRHKEVADHQAAAVVAWMKDRV